MDSFQTSLTPEQANAFLDALVDPEYRARLEDPEQRKAALAEQGIDVSDGFAAGMVELPEIEAIDAIRAGNPIPPPPGPPPTRTLPCCKGLALALVAASIAEPPTSE